MDFESEHQWFANTDGSFIDQYILQSGAGYTATTLGNNDTQRRSYPVAGGNYAGMGYELVLGLNLLENAERVREEGIALLTAKPLPPSKRDIILLGNQMHLQIHESVGHATELDRVLGMEANYAGTSFATLEKMGKFKYGSEIVNLVADSTLPNGMGTFGWDDDGVAAQRYHIVKNGILQAYSTNRELAHVVGEKRSRGCSRADGFSNLPIIRIPNLSLMPGSWEWQDMLDDSNGAIVFDSNKCWSIDQQRLNFQFSTEIAWEVKGGKLGTIFKNPTYQGITPEFWGNCDAICNQKHWVLWGVNNCGKGQPGQRAQMTHGSAPTRFRNVNVGVGN
jgi:TldD protein